MVKSADLHMKLPFAITVDESKEVVSAVLDYIYTGKYAFNAQLRASEKLGVRLTSRAVFDIDVHRAAHWYAIESLMRFAHERFLAAIGNADARTIDAVIRKLYRISTMASGILEMRKATLEELYKRAAVLRSYAGIRRSFEEKGGEFYMDFVEVVRLNQSLADSLKSEDLCISGGERRGGSGPFEVPVTSASYRTPRQNSFQAFEAFRGTPIGSSVTTVGNASSPTLNSVYEGKQSLNSPVVHYQLEDESDDQLSEQFATPSTSGQNTPTTSGSITPNLNQFLGSEPLAKASDIPLIEKKISFRHAMFHISIGRPVD